MMEFLKKNMVLVGGAAVLFLGVVVYLNVFAGKSNDPLLTTSAEAESPVSKDLLVTLSNLHTIKLDTTVLTSTMFESLINFGVTIPPENVGRPNPFLPVSVK